MEQSTSQYPPLFRAEGTAAAPGFPALIGGQCQACGAVFYPMQFLGCERCGSLETVEKALAGRGTLLTRAKVHQHKSPGLEAPFTVGAIRTEEGAFVRGLIDPAVADELRIGDTVVTMLVAQTRPDRGETDVRFTTATR